VSGLPIHIYSKGHYRLPGGQLHLKQSCENLETTWKHYEKWSYREETQIIYQMPDMIFDAIFFTSSIIMNNYTEFNSQYWVYVNYVSLDSNLLGPQACGHI
jgi:hypothetical protein